MRAALDDRALVEHDDFIGVDDGREAMRDDQRGAAARDAVERVLDLALGEGIERRGRFVENEDGRIFQNGAGDGDALLFAAGEFQPALADLRFIAARRLFDEAVDLREARRLLTSASLAPSRP